MCRCILFGNNHNLERRIHNQETSNHCCSRPGFPRPKDSANGAICSSLQDRLHQGSKHRQEVAVWVCHQWPNGLQQGLFFIGQPFVTSRCARSTQGKLEQFTEAANNGPRSPGKMGVKFSSTRSPHPKHSRSGHVGKNSKFFRTPCVNEEHHIFNEEVRLESTSLQPHVRFIEGKILALSSPTQGITAEGPRNVGW